MPVINPSPSPETMTALLASTGMLLRAGEVSRGELAHPLSGYPVFTLGLQDLVKAGSFQDATPTSWRFLVRGTSGQAVAIEVSTRSGAPKATSAWRGRPVEENLQANEDLRTRPEMRDGPFELRGLRIPGLNLEALWLKSPGGGDDRFIPFLSLSGELERNRAYEGREFEQKIVQMAESKVRPAGVPMEAPPAAKGEKPRKPPKAAE